MRRLYCSRTFPTRARIPACFAVRSTASSDWRWRWTPILENYVEKSIDLESFPVPRWHELDGGRYIGTDDLVITQDPEEGWINAGTYRVMLQAQDALALYISPGKHGG